MVEVFKTDVTVADLANKLIFLLHQHWPEARISFDLEDCDKVLRIEAQDFDAAKVCSLLQTHGVRCEIMF